MTHIIECQTCEKDIGECEDSNCLLGPRHTEAEWYCSECGEDENRADEVVAMRAACRKLIAAYENSVDQVAWEDLNDAYQAACDALGRIPTYPRASVRPMRS